MTTCKSCDVSLGGAFGDPIHPADPTMCKACGDDPQVQAAFREAAEKAEKIRNAHLVRVYTTDRVVGAANVEYVGFVRGGTVRAKHVGKDLMAGLKNIVGGEVKQYTQLIAEAREEAVQRMREDAALLGADSVIGMNFSTSVVDAGVAEITAFGTAVKTRLEGSD